MSVLVFLRRAVVVTSESIDPRTPLLLYLSFMMCDSELDALFVVTVEASLADQVTEENIAECADFFLIDMHTMRDNSTKVRLPAIRPGEGIYTFRLFAVWWLVKVPFSNA